jgi:dTDP-4-dehydrorhamnose reductase
MRHAILGNGNLGNALAKEIIKKGEEFKIFSTTTSWKYPSSDLTPIHDFIPDHVWVTVGAGSVEQALSDYRPFADLHIRLPLELAQTLNSHVTLHLFSTDYCEVDPQSLYALSKKHMEDLIVMLGREKTFIYRVGSLYGTFKPQKCFPYKLKRNFVAGKVTKLPTNFICPTPVDWLAEELLSGAWDEELCTVRVKPNGMTTVLEWGEMILERKLEAATADLTRPVSVVDVEMPTPSWLELWRAREVDWL